MMAGAVHSADISKNKHRGNACSNTAFEGQRATADIKRNLIFHKLRQHPFGLTAKELADYFRVPLHSISGRITELKLAGRVLRTEERRDGCAVVVALEPNRDILAGVIARMDTTAEVDG